MVVVRSYLPLDILHLGLVLRPYLVHFDHHLQARWPSACQYSQLRIFCLHRTYLYAVGHDVQSVFIDLFQRQNLFLP
jgi:hypothetical protein